MSGISARTQRSRTSISPLSSRKSPASPYPAMPESKTGARPTTALGSRPHSSKLMVSPANSISPSTPSLDRPDFSKAKENVTVTVRFRPLSGREINKGDEIDWYADGDHTVRNEYNPSIAYGFGDENAEMQETILSLREQHNSLLVKGSSHVKQISDSEATTTHRNCSAEPSQKNGEWKGEVGSHEATNVDEKAPTSMTISNGISFQEDSRRCHSNMSLNAQVLMQAAEVENLKQEKVRLIEEKDGLEIHSQKLAEEALYAKELAAAAAVELKNLAEEVTRLSYENAKLTEDLAAAKEALCRSNGYDRHIPFNRRQVHNTRLESCLRKPEDEVLVEKLQKELLEKCQREASLEFELSERDHRENKLQKRLEEARRRGEDLQNELANMWVLVAKMKKIGCSSKEISLEGAHASNISHIRIENEFPSSNGPSSKMFESVETCRNMDEWSTLEELSAGYNRESRRCRELESIISRLKSENLLGLDINALEELQNFLVEAITKICHAKFADHVLIVFRGCLIVEYYS